MIPQPFATPAHRLMAIRAERHGARRGSVSDIFLPDAVARTIPVWSSALVAIAIALHARSALGRSASRARRG